MSRLHRGFLSNGASCFNLGVVVFSSLARYGVGEDGHEDKFSK